MSATAPSSSSSSSSHTAPPPDADLISSLQSQIDAVEADIRTVELEIKEAKEELKSYDPQDKRWDLCSATLLQLRDEKKQLRDQLDRKEVQLQQLQQPQQQAGEEALSLSQSLSHRCRGCIKLSFDPLLCLMPPSLLLSSLSLSLLGSHTRLLTHGFPLLSPSALILNSPSSTPAGSGKHQPAQLNLKDMHLLSQEEYQAQPIRSSQIWAAADEGRVQLKWATESDIQGFVKSALSDCIRTSGLEEQLELLNELSVDDMRPDIWVLHLHKKDGATLNLPVGVGEVKKPKRRVTNAVVHSPPDALASTLSSLCLSPAPSPAAALTTARSPRLIARACAAASSSSSSSSALPPSSVQALGLDKPTLLGQIFDYMCLLRAQYGLRYVFGILSNYVEWRIVWLPDTQVAADATELPFEPATPADVDSPTLRVLHGTRIFSCDNPTLVQHLVSMLHKMAHSPHEPPKQLLQTDRPYFTGGEFPPYSWQKLKPQFTLSLLTPVHPNSSRFHLLQDYRGGADGRVWLIAAESSGAMGVVKFPKREADSLGRSSLEAEAKIWREVWNSSSARVITLSGQHALLMPFAFHAQQQLDGSVRFLKPDHQQPDEAASYLADVSTHELNAIICAANSDPLTVAREAVTAMVEKQYEHLDVHWRHVAFLLLRGSNNALVRHSILIDLTRVEKLQSTDVTSKAEAIERMLASLAPPPHGALHPHL
jgi:hypothetical protein